LSFLGVGVDCGFEGVEGADGFGVGGEAGIVCLKRSTCDGSDGVGCATRAVG
jgi:hypothetical protein